MKAGRYSENRYATTNKSADLSGSGAQAVVTVRDFEREGYRGRHGSVPGKSGTASGMLRIQTEERLGSLLSAAGVIWGVYDATKDLTELWKFSVLSPGPLEVCALGVLLWLHAKWRRSVKIG